MKRLTSLLVAAIAVLLYAGVTRAATATLTADPEIYKITIHKVRVYNQTDGQWHVAGSGALTFDVTSADAGDVVGNYINDAPLTEGTYTQIEVTLSRTFYLKAKVTDTGALAGVADPLLPVGATYYTTSTTISDAIKCATNDLSSYALGTAVIPSDATLPSTETIVGDYLIHTDTLPNIVVNKGVTSTTRVSFNTSGAATFQAQSGWNFVICYPSPPTVTITQTQ